MGLVGEGEEGRPALMTTGRQFPGWGRQSLPPFCPLPTCPTRDGEGSEKEPPFYLPTTGGGVVEKCVTFFFFPCSSATCRLKGEPPLPHTCLYDLFL